jgi:hypothetical protein
MWVVFALRSCLCAQSSFSANQAAENALRTLIKFYHNKHYATSQSGPEYHRRSDSLTSGGSVDHGPGQHVASSNGSGSIHRTDSDIFPPNRTMPRRETDDDYNIETIMGAWLYEYEDLIAEVLGIDRAEEHVQQGLDLLSSPGGRRASLTNAFRTNDTPWSRLNEIMKSRGMADDDAISDSESVVSIGELGADARFSTYDMEQEMTDEPEDSFAARQRRKSTGNENTWEVSEIWIFRCYFSDACPCAPPAYLSRDIPTAKITQRAKSAQIKLWSFATSSSYRAIRCDGLAGFGDI